MAGLSHTSLGGREVPSRRVVAGRGAPFDTYIFLRWIDSNLLSTRIYPAPHGLSGLGDSRSCCHSRLRPHMGYFGSDK